MDTFCMIRESGDEILGSAIQLLQKYEIISEYIWNGGQSNEIWYFMEMLTENIIYFNTWESGIILAYVYENIKYTSWRQQYRLD